MRTKASLLARLQEHDGDLLVFERMVGQNQQAWKRTESGANDPVRTREVQVAAMAVAARFREVHTLYRKKLSAIAEGLP